MGDFKPLLPFGDTTIAFHVTSMLRRLGADPVIVVTGYRAEELEAHLKGTGACFVRNTRYRHTQMFDSVKLGIQAGRLCGRSMTANRGIPYAWKGRLPDASAPIPGTRDLRGPLKPQACL